MRSNSNTTSGLNLPSQTRGGERTIATRSTSSSSSRTMRSQVPSSSGALNLPPHGFRGSAATRSVASDSNATSIPPPPATETLQRGAYLQTTTPGAQQFPGLVEPDDGTIIIGDGQSSVATNPHGILSARRVDSSSRSQDQIIAPVYRIPGRDYDAPSAPVHRVTNAQRLLQKPTVKAELMRDEEKPMPFWKDWRVMCCVLFLFVLAIGLGVAFAIGLNTTSSEASSLATTTNPPTQLPATPAPSLSPTIEFSRPNSARCETIGKGLAVDNQESLIVKRFSLDLDVTLVDQVPTIGEDLEEFRINLLQQDIAPEIAHCYDNRRQLQLLDRFVVGNAIFESVAMSDAGCGQGGTGNCFAILATLAVYLKDDVQDSALVEHIGAVFEGGLELTLPFKSIELTGSLSYTIEDVPGATSAPSYEEDDYEDEHTR